MTPDDIARVRATVAQLGEHPEFATRFYARLFEVAPEVAPMFGDVASQRQKLADELGAMVELLGDLGALDGRARALGERHRGYGVRAVHYRVALDVMVATLDEVLGAAFTPEDRDSWRRGTNLITELMQSA
jgi:nitric oxide dioxygenase